MPDRNSHLGPVTENNAPGVLASQPIPAPVDSGAIGRLNEAEREELAQCIRSAWINSPWAAPWERASEHARREWRRCASDVAEAVVERIFREHTDRALAEVEQRIDQCGVRNDSAQRWGITTALHIVRDYRRERSIDVKGALS